MSDARTQGFSKRVSLLAFKANRALTIMSIKEQVNEETGDIIPAHDAVMVFTPKTDEQGNVLRKEGKVIPDRDKAVDWVSFGPSVEGFTMSDLRANASELVVGTLAESGNYVLYKDNQQGISGEVWE